MVGAFPFWLPLLWPPPIPLLLSSGRVAELLGEEGLQQDVIARTLGFSVLGAEDVEVPPWLFIPFILPSLLPFCFFAAVS